MKNDVDLASNNSIQPVLVPETGERMLLITLEVPCSEYEVSGDTRVVYAAV